MNTLFLSFTMQLNIIKRAAINDIILPMIMLFIIFSFLFKETNHQGLCPTTRQYFSKDKNIAYGNSQIFLRKSARARQCAKAHLDFIKIQPILQMGKQSKSPRGPRWL